MRRRDAGTLLGLLAAANLMHYAVRNAPSALYGDLRAGFGASEAELGLIGTAFMVPHAIATVLVGFLSDRFDRRRVMAVGMVVWSLATALAAMADSMGMFLVTRGLVGLGTAACVPVANVLICDAFAPAVAARAVSIFNLGLFLGGVVGVVCGEALGFPVALWVLAGPGLVLAGLLATARDHASPRPARPRRAGTAVVELRRDVGAIIASRPFRWTAVGAVLMAFAAGGYLAWFVDFLHTKAMSKAQVTSLFAIALGGGLAGVVTGAAVADRLRRTLRHGRHLAIALGFAGAVPCAIAAIELPPGLVFDVACCGLMFFVSWYHGPIAASIDELAPEGREATAQGLYIFLMHALGTAPASYLVGLAAAEVGLARALYLPTASMALAGLVFLGAARAVAGQGDRAVLQRGP